MGLLHFCRGEHAGDSGEHFFKAGDFVFQVADAGCGEPVDAGGTALGGGSGLGVELSLAEHALESGVERAFFNLEEVV